nr:protein 124 [synthetic construct]
MHKVKYEIPQASRHHRLAQPQGQTDFRPLHRKAPTTILCTSLKQLQAIILNFFRQAIQIRRKRFLTPRMDHPVARSLIVGKVYSDLSNGSLVIPSNDCFCLKWLKSRGSTIEQKIANALQWFAFGLSVLILIYYAYATWKTTCGWEEVYVCCVELTKVVIEFFHEFDAPSMLYLSNGNRVLWLRYAEWLLTCPVILIHLSNLTGLKDDYNKRTMRLLVSDIGTIVWGTTAAMSTGYVKVIFFLMGVIYGANTFFHAAKVYIEAYHTVPKGLCRQVVRVMAWLFFASWGMFPVLFLLGPEGFGHIGLYGSTIGHTVIDLLSKNCWGLLGNFLRVKIHEHILLYGDIRKVQKIKVAGQELEVETMMTEEATDTI